MWWRADDSDKGAAGLRLAICFNIQKLGHAILRSDQKAQLQSNNAVIRNHYPAAHKQCQVALFLRCGVVVAAPGYPTR